MATAAERKARQRAKEKAAGLVPFSGMVHPDQLPDLLHVLQLLRDNPTLTVVTLRDTATGKFRGLKEPKPKAPKRKTGPGTFLGRPCIWVRGIPYAKG